MFSLRVLRNPLLALAVFACLIVPAAGEGLFPLFTFGAVRELARKDVVEWDKTKIRTEQFQRYYQSQNYGSTWTNGRGLNGNGKALVGLLKNAGDDGLNPEDYLRGKADKLAKLSGKDIAYAEIFLTDAFVNFSSDLFKGRTPPSIKAKNIVIEPKKVDVDGWLTAARRRGPASVIKEVRPQGKQYRGLMDLISNTTDAAKRRKIAANMERWRWLPTKLGAKYVLVNQPAYTMYTIVNGRQIDKRKVIIGDLEHPTPMFQQRISLVQFNPEWNVPKTIAGKEFLPKLINDPRYLEKNGYHLEKGWGETLETVDPRKVNWSKINKEKFPYRIVQGSGDDNALGQVKFLFPNKFDVYLHDTPTKKLFDKDERALSHGCIRVQEPLEFAKILFSLDEEVGEVDIEAELAKEGISEITMSETGVPIYLAYFTVWIDESGSPQYYSDVYGRDAIVEAKL